MSGVSVLIGSTTAAISWKTDLPASGVVEYGLSPASEWRFGDPGLRTTHSLRLSGLTPETTYYYRLHSRGRDGGEALSLIQSFRTKAADALPETIVLPPTPATTTAKAALRSVPPAALKKLSLSRDLKRGSRGSEVSALQTFLAQDKSLYPEAQVTGYFGPLTEQAVKRYQVRFLLRRTGMVNQKTREKLNTQK